MKTFDVTFIDLEGLKRTERFQAFDVESLTHSLEAQKLILLRIRKSSMIETLFYKIRLQKISDDEIVEVIHTLHLMVKSGLPLQVALKDLAHENSNIRLKRMLRAIAHAVASGSALSDAMMPYSTIFSISVIQLIRIGEKSAVLESTLLKAKEFLEKRMMLKQAVKSALIYPALVFTVAFSAILLWFIFVLPQLEEMFAQMNVTLPWLTRFLVGLGQVVSASYLYVGFVLALIVSLLYYTYQKNSLFRSYVMQKLMSVPLIGLIIRYYNIAYIAQYLQLSLNSGNTLFKALQTIGENISNPLYLQSIKQIIARLEQGETFSKALQQELLYSSFTVRMIQSGEKSGDLESQLYTIAHYYYEKLNNYAQNISKILEPAMIIFVGGFFALIMLGLMGPIFDLVSYVE